MLNIMNFDRQIWYDLNRAPDQLMGTLRITGDTHVHGPGVVFDMPPYTGDLVRTWGT